MGRGVDAELPDRLPLLRAVVDETLRLYPPVPRFDREAVAADRLGEHEVQPGDLVSIWPWIIQRHRKLWDKPDAFDPDRFAPDRKHDRHRFQYLPFGAGPRTCVGARFSMAEALTILAIWLRQWRVRTGAGEAGAAFRHGDIATGRRLAAHIIAPLIKHLPDHHRLWHLCYCE